MPNRMSADGRAGLWPGKSHGPEVPRRPRVHRGSSWSRSWRTRSASRGGSMRRCPSMARQVAWPSSITSSLVSCVIRLTSIPNSKPSAPPTRRSRVGDRAERIKQGMQLGGDIPARAGEQDPGTFGQDAAEAAPAAVDLSSPPALAAGVVQPRSPGARAADRPALLVTADQRPHRPAADALGGVAADMLVAAGAHRPGGPFRLDRAIAPAPEARPGRPCPAHF